MLYNVLNFLLFIKKFQILKIFTPFSIVLDRFLLIYDVGDRFEHRFDHCFDLFVLISGIMFKLAYRLGLTSVFILHDLMTISL